MPEPRNNGYVVRSAEGPSIASSALDPVAARVAARSALARATEVAAKSGAKQKSFDLTPIRRVVLHDLDIAPPPLRKAEEPMSDLTAQELHDLRIAAAFRGDYKTADAWRLLEANVRGGEVIKQWTHARRNPTEAEVRQAATYYALGWGASPLALYEQAMSVLRDAGHAPAPVNRDLSPLGWTTT